MELLDQMRAQQPLVHCISNLVTANACANLLLAAGARPIMAQAPQEAAEISAFCRATVLNTGTPDGEKFRACRLAGRAAREAGHPVILDPVGAGASAYRRKELARLLEEGAPSVIRGNLGEVQALLELESDETGVDCVSEGADAQRQRLAVRLARRRKCVVYLSGAVDVVTDGERLALVSGGSARMRCVTGAGCMLSVLMGAFTAVSRDVLEGAVAAGAFWKACAARAGETASGAGSFQTALFDAASLLSAREVRERCGVEFRAE